MRSNFKVKTNNAVAAKSGGEENANKHLYKLLALKGKLYLCIWKIIEKIKNTNTLNIKQLRISEKKNCIFFALSGNKMGIKTVM